LESRKCWRPIQNSRPRFIPLRHKRNFSSRGNVVFERCFVSTAHRCGFVPFETIERAISDVGVSTTVLSTDLGQPDTPPPVEGLLLYAEGYAALVFQWTIFAR
jgi:hypothetical protein